MKTLGRTVEVDTVSDSAWNELIDHFDDANIYQTWAYGAVRWGADNLSHLVLKRDGKLAGIAQLRIVGSTRFRFGMAYLRWGPLCHLRGEVLDREDVLAMATALREEYVNKRGLYLEILPNAFSGSDRADVFQSAFSSFANRPGVATENYRTLVLDLSSSPRDLRRGLDKKWRNQLNVSERNDLKVIEGDGAEEYRAFSTLYAQMWERKRFATPVSIQEFGHIQEQLPDALRMKVLLCEHDGRLTAGVVYSALGTSAIYLLGATNDAGLRLKSSYLLQWTLIRRLQEQGIRYYDLGGIDPKANPGVHHFKSGLSGVDLSYISSFTACDSSLNRTAVKAGQMLRNGLLRVHERFAHA